MIAIAAGLANDCAAVACSRGWPATMRKPETGETTPLKPDRDYGEAGIILGPIPLSGSADDSGDALRGLRKGRSERGLGAKSAAR